MFDSVALNVVIGLVFIYLLYSLLATVISELFITFLGIRARNLKVAIDRMLNDDKKTNFLQRFMNSLMLMKNPDNKNLRAFYSQPEIRYMSSSGLFRTPSFINADSFSRSLKSMLFGTEAPDKATIEEKIKAILDPETASYIQGLWLEAKEDADEFSKQLESWFDRTMEHASEWYKRKVRVFVFLVGFCLAWFFNADTFVMVKSLSTDKDAREKLVSMANSYLQNAQLSTSSHGDSTTYSNEEMRARLDSLLLVKSKLEKDIADAGSILGTGCWTVDADKSFWIKLGNMFSLLYFHFFGILITAIAISLGAPFWFDLLNKIMQLSTTKKASKTSSS